MSSEWNVIFRTGHGEAEGSRGNAYLQITDKAYKKTPIVKFGDSQPGLYDPNSKDKFSFILPEEFKTIHKIHVWHEGSGSWNLESVRLQHQNEDPIFFDVQEKLPSGHIVERAPIHDDNSVQVIYDVSCLAGSTAALTFINIIGSLGHTRFRPFDPKKSTSIKAISIGEISELQLKFEGDNGTWPLEKVEIATKQSNGSILREVFKTQYNQRMINTGNTVSLTPCKVECLYKAEIVTRKTNFAGTNAIVFCTLYDKFGRQTSTPFQLNSLHDDIDSKVGEEFIAGKTRLVDFYGPYEGLGELDHIEIWHNGAGLAPSWQPQSIKLVDQKTSKSFVFMFVENNKYVEIKSGQKYKAIANRFTEYQIDVKTADKLWAGTDNTVSLNLTGLTADGIKLDSGLMKLDASNRNDHERGQTCHYEYPAVDFEKLLTCQVLKEGSIEDDWQLETVTVRYNGKVDTFYFNQVIKNKTPVLREANKKEAEPEPELPVKENKPELVDLYKGFVWTANKLGAGTDAKVKCMLYDVTGKNCGAPFVFRQKQGTVMQRGCMNEITFRGSREKVNLDDLMKMEIKHDGSGFMSDWMLERICLTDCFTGNKFNFVFCENFKFDNVKKGATYLTFANEFEIYAIKIKTTDKLYAGTDNDVYMNIKGVKEVVRDGTTIEKVCETGEFALDKSGRNDFERGNVDDFRIPAKSVGRITQVIITKRKTISHDDWHLEWVEIYQEGTSVKSGARYNDWVKKEPISLEFN